jgi:SAM-dependent methyltransferase
MSVEYESPEHYDAQYYGMSEPHKHNYHFYGPQSVPHWSLPLARWLVENAEGPFLDLGSAYGHLVRDINLLLSTQNGLVGPDGQPLQYARGIEWSPFAIANRVTDAVIEGDARQLPWPDDTFNTIITLDFLEHHLPWDTYRIMKEMVRVGKKGHLQIHLIGWGTEQPKPDEITDPTHLNFSPPEWYKAQLQSLGMVMRDDIRDELREVPAWKDTDWHGRFIVAKSYG